MTKETQETISRPDSDIISPVEMASVIREYIQVRKNITVAPIILPTKDMHPQFMAMPEPIFKQMVFNPAYQKMVVAFSHAQIYFKHTQHETIQRSTA